MTAERHNQGGGSNFAPALGDGGRFIRINLTPRHCFAVPIFNMVKAPKNKNKYAAIGRTVGTALRLGYKAYKGYSYYKNATKKGPSQADHALTNQYDSKMTYRRKRMGFRQKRRRKFEKKIRKIINTDKALDNFLRHTEYTVTSGLAQQGVFDIPQMSINGSAGSGNDLEVLFNTVESVPAGTVRKLRIKGCILDVVIRNTHATSTALIDIYEITYRKDLPLNIAANLSVLLTAQAAALPQLNPVDAPMVVTTPGMTPFEVPQFLEYIRINRKRKLVLSPGQVGTLQNRVFKNKTIWGDRLQNLTGMRNWTTGYLCLFTGAPDPANQAGNVQQAPVTLCVNTTRAYHYWSGDDAVTADVV